MAIQMRRGLRKDFDPNKMLPGEWAVSIDTSTSNQIVWMCFAPGVCKRMGTYEDFKAQISEASDEIIAQFIVQLTDASEDLKDSTEQYIQGKVDNTWLPNLQSYVDAAQNAANFAHLDAQSALESKNAAAESENNTKVSEKNAKSYSDAAGLSAEQAAKSQETINGVEERVSADKEAADLSASNAAESEKRAIESEKNARESEINAKKSEDTTAEKALSAEKDAAEALESKEKAASSADIASQKADETLENAAEVASNTEISSQKAKDAENSALMARSYTEGDTELRPSENVDNARFYYEQAKLYANTAKGSGLRPMGSIKFAQLSEISPEGNDLYDILDDFESDERFVDGGGVQYGAGTEVYWTDEGKWNAMPGAGVAGIKGEAESAYRKGLVDITKDNVGLGNVPNVTTNDQTPTFFVAAKRENIASNDKLSVIMGKIMKFFSDLKTVAFTGKYNDLTGTPSSLPANGGTADKVSHTLKFTGGATGNFDGSEDKTIIIPSNTDDKVDQNNTATDADYRVLLSKSANDDNETAGAQKSGNLKFNPRTGTLETTKVNADTEGSTVTFISGDVADESAENWTNVTPITTGETHKSLLQKISQMFKNVRYLYKMLGNTDISAIGNGTVTDAISALNSSISGGNANIKFILTNVYLDVPSMDSSTTKITTDFDIPDNAHIFAFPYGTSTGKPNCVPTQVYRSGAREITLSIVNFLSTAVSKSVRQGYIIMII